MPESRLYVPGAIFGAVPMVSRADESFTHLLCDKTFYETLKSSGVIWTARKDAWSKIKRTYKAPSDGPMHVFEGNARSFLIHDATAFDISPFVECFIKGHIVGYAVCDGGAFTCCMFDATEDARAVFKKRAIAWEDGVLSDATYADVVGATSAEVLSKKKSTVGAFLASTT